MSWTNPAFETVIHLLGERTGLTFPPQRHDSAELGISRAMAHSGVGDLDQYRTRLETDPAALDDLIVELTVGETYFFREPGHFAFIRQEVLPELWRRRGPEHGVRAWSAACASGEEAYSLAIVFAESGLGGQSYLLATDISRAALAKAHRAVYSNWSLRGEGAGGAAPYLSKHGKLHTLEDRIRRMVTFEYLNLGLDVYPSFATGTWGMDLILCRNVLIYFDSETVRKVARRLFESLAPGGWLLTASSDPPLGEDAPYETVVTDAGVFYRRGQDRPSSIDDRRLRNVETIVPVTAPLPIPLVTPSIETPESAISNQQSALDMAREAFARGNYVQAAELTREELADLSSCMMHVRSLANLETEVAERACAEATLRHPLAVELHYLHAVLLLELGRDEEAGRSARRVIYLDRSLALGHFTLGSILKRRGDLAGARRAYRNARDLCAARPAKEVVPLSDGEHTGRLAQAAAAELAILDTVPEETS